MPKKEVEPIVIADELPNPVSSETALPEIVMAAVTAQATGKQPSQEAVMAYWTPGREATMEVPAMIAEYSVKCAKCEAKLPYIPIAGQDAPTLTCDNCAK